MLKIYNSLTRKVEPIKPLKRGKVGMYTCGPTVYHFATIGNFRTYTTADLLLRTLRYTGLQVNYVMNITDVGHLTGDNLGDADTGEDRMEKSAKKEGKSVWEVAKFYTEIFLEDYDRLHLTRPEYLVKATDHISEQIDLIETLETKGYTYETSDGVYFDTTRMSNYGELSNLDQIHEGARVEINEEKHNPRDFALWKFSYPHGRAFDPKLDDESARRQMEWKSPWGVGFPGWHIECSAMSMKYLGPTIDLHLGGMDLRETHHPNEIAQSEAATGRTFVNYWVHGAFVLVNGEKMSKSKGNVYRVYDIEKEGYDPLALRYLYMQVHYRQEMNFTLTALDGAQSALKRLRDAISKYEDPSDDKEKWAEEIIEEFAVKFKEALEDDLNMPQALATVWEVVRSDYSGGQKAATLLHFDEVLGFDLATWREEHRRVMLDSIPSEVRELVHARQELRKNKQFAMSDQLRNKIKKLGYDVEDTKRGIEIKKIDE